VVCQTKYCFSLKVKILRSPKKLGLATLLVPDVPKRKLRPHQQIPYPSHAFQSESSWLRYIFYDALKYEARRFAGSVGLIKENEQNQPEASLDWFRRAIITMRPSIEAGKHRSWAGIIN